MLNLHEKIAVYLKVDTRTHEGSLLKKKPFSVALVAQEFQPPLNLVGHNYGVPQSTSTSTGFD